MTKQLTQDVFKDAPKWVRSAAVDDDGLNKARKMLAKWVTDDMDGSASEQPYYSIDSFYCYAHELAEYDLSEVRAR